MEIFDFPNLKTIIENPQTNLLTSKIKEKISSF